MRGGLVGAAVVVLAVAAHGWAGGGHPGSAALTLLVLIATATGTFASIVPPVRWSRTAVLGVLGGGQGAAHLALSTVHSHGTAEIGNGSGLFAVSGHSGWMTAAHAVATVVCALLIAAAERLYAAVSRSVRAVTTRPRALPGPAAGARYPVPRQPRQQLGAHRVSPRAPPVPA